MDEIVNYMDDYNLKYDDELKETADEIIAKTGKLDKPSSELKPKSKEASQLSSRPRIYNIWYRMCENIINNMKKTGTLIKVPVF